MVSIYSGGGWVGMTIVHHWGSRVLSVIMYHGEGRVGMIRVHSGGVGVVCVYQWGPRGVAVCAPTWGRGVRVGVSMGSGQLVSSPD